MPFRTLAGPNTRRESLQCRRANAFFVESRLKLKEERDTSMEQTWQAQAGGKATNWRPRLDSRNHAIPILENLPGPPITKRQRRLLKTTIRLRCCLVHKTYSKGKYKFTPSPCLLENPQHRKIGCDRYLQTIVLTLSQPPQRSDKPTYTLCMSNFSNYRGVMFVT